MPSGNKDKRPKDLVDGLFELAFPCPEVMVQRVVDAVRKSFTLSDQAKQEQNGEFEKICGTRNFITKDQYRAATREYVKRTVPDKNVRKLIRHDVKVQRRKNNIMKLDESQANTGKITKTDFLNGRSYVHLLSSLASYNADGDAVMDRPEFVAWLVDRCGIHDEAYADAVIQQFAGDAELQIKVLLDCLFERAFPTEEARVRRVVECIQKAFKLTSEERQIEEKDFEDFCGKGTEFITMERYREIAKAELNKKFPGKNMKKALDAKVKKMEEKDRNQDGNITKTEFLIHRIFWRFENAFEHSYEDEIEEADFAAWLRKTFTSLYSKATGERESMLDASAIFEVVLPGGELQVLLDGLFDRAFPPSNVRVKRVIEAIRTTFGLELEEADKLMDEFDKLNDEEDFLPMDVYLPLVEKAFQEKFKDTKIPKHVIDRLLKKRIDNVKKKDLNADGKITREEFLNGEIFLALETSLNCYDADGDLIMEKPEFISWLAERCQLYDEAYTDAVMQEFLPDGALTLKVEELTDGLFDRAFPSADFIVDEMVKGVHELCQLTSEENEEATNEFNEISGGNTFFTMEQFKDKTEKLVEGRYGKGASSRKDRIRGLKHQIIQENGLNNDGKISRDEYVATERYIKLDESLREYGEKLDDLADDVMDLEEFERWLAERCQITDDVKTYAILATQEFLPDEEDQLHLGVLAKGLFKRAYPSAA
ncbi:uncharacterized protein LOC135495911 isoform X2 [Lineus longissimus]|uniref:uncharacterized protein LOC135495911 isoform X2 n=1 Tax=Lineus longissimus TaxID=88925 RepID=UPI002B4C6443